MRFGINTFIFTCPFTNRSTQLFPQFREIADDLEAALEQFATIAEDLK